MNFSNLYPFNRNKILMEGLAKDPKFKNVERQLFAEKEEIDQLFEKLRRIETKEALEIAAKPNSQPQGILTAQPSGLLEECDRIINRQTILANPASKPIVLSMLAIKMQIYSELGMSEEIQKNYSNFLRATREITAVSKKMPRYLLNYLDYSLVVNCRKEVNDLTSHLVACLPVKEGTNLNQMTVPDVLAQASVTTQDGPNKANIRRIFHELWEVKSLQPLLTVAAYAVNGHYVHEGEIKEKPPFKIIFNNDSLGGHSSDGTTFGMASSDNIIISLKVKSGKGVDFLQSNAAIGGVIAHELHHGWEKLRHFQHAALPYKQAEEEKIKAPTTSQRFFKLFSTKKIEPQDPNAAVKTRLNKMLQEAKDLKITNSILAEEARNELGIATLTRQPFLIFKAVNDYPKDEDTQHTEIVVRVSHALGLLSNHSGYTEEKAFEIMQKSGLTECLSFFEEERKQMEILAQEFAEKTGVTFATPQKFCEISEYLDYTPTPLHSAVISGDRDLLAQLLKENPASLKDKDSFGQNALELALDFNQPEMIFEFSKSQEVQQELVKNPQLFRKAIFYLIDLAKDETSPHSQEALSLFREAKEKVTNSNTVPPAISRIFSDAQRATWDKDLISKIKSKTPEEIVTAINQGEIPFRDKFGNDFSDYSFEASYEFKLPNSVYDKTKSFLSKHFPETFPQRTPEWKVRLDLICRKVKEKYSAIFSQFSDSFLPHDPLRDSVAANKPQEFLKILEGCEAPLETLQQKLGFRLRGNDSALELATHNCTTRPESKTEWFEICKKIIREYKIDPTQKYGTTHKTLIDLLPEDLKEEARNTYKEVTREDVEKVAKKMTEEILAKSVEKVAPKTTAAFFEAEKLQSEKQQIQAH